MTPGPNRKRLVVMASGAGSTFRAIAEAVRSGRLKVELAGLVVSRQGVGAETIAAEFAVPACALDPRDFAAREDWDWAVADQVSRWQADWIALAGFMQLLGPIFLGRFPHRVVNIHPSLLPRHGGHGMYGMKVHAAVVAAGDKESGVTIHEVTAEYDRGPILAQKKVPVLSGDSAESLAERIKKVEREFYVSVLAELTSQ